MTERILSPQLLKLVQAAGPGYSLADPEWVKKFAELIVADCVKIIEGYCETSPEIYGLPLDILEHFDMELKDEF